MAGALVAEDLNGIIDGSAEADVELPVDRKRAFAVLVAFRPWTFWSLVE